MLGAITSSQTRSPLSTFEDALFRALRLMDEEACKTWKGSTTGLNFYGGHFRPNLVKPPTETSWTRRLEQLLPLFGFPARREFPYPHSSESCDSLVMLEDGSSLWLETKGAWKKYWQDKGKEGIYWSYLLHPLVPNLSVKDHTAALDIQKLNALRRPRADFVGLLLLGFDADDSPMDTDVSRFVELAGLGSPPWSARSTRWADRYRRKPPCGVKAWLWHRPVESFGDADELNQQITIPSSPADAAWPNRPRAARIFKWFMDAELIQDKTFRWGMPIGHLLRLPATSEFVVKAGDALRKSELRYGKYSVRNYLDPARFDGLLVSIREIICRGEVEGWHAS